MLNLIVMKTVKSDKPDQLGRESNKAEDYLSGYPVYPEEEDIYNNYEEEIDIDPENLFQKKESSEKMRFKRNPELNLDDGFPGDDLDIPGAELDDEMENIGSEDEENNYYSLGGDDHDDLDEDQA